MYMFIENCMILPRDIGDQKRRWGDHGPSHQLQADFYGIP